ncbi:hypothetical protein [Pseudomonas sp. GM_Psu_2]|uniref:hypothetical protein n=1 Tax=unclassified Pseudomonas TaxID=196821 RepID=UPI00226A2CC1|nr:hypothetical protein [Pseudomonas sp. GM_Psu_2]
MDFFAISSSQDTYRMDIDQALQQELENIFLDQAKAINGTHLTSIPFMRENFHPDETEVLELTPFTLPPHISTPLQNIVGCATLNRSPDILASISCIFAYDQTDDLAIFQVIPKSQRLNTALVNIILSRNTFTKLEDPGIVIGNSCHAVYQKGSIKFKKLWWLKQIIDITPHYRTATDADIVKLCQHPEVHVANPAALNQNTGQWARTRIAYILDSKILDNFTTPQLVALATTHNINLQVHTSAQGNKLIIPDDNKELREVLKFLEEEYYIGPITGENYETNNKRKRT